MENIVLWVLQGVLGAAFIAGGSAKVLTDKTRSQERMPWMGRFGQPTVRFIGVVEVLGGLGLILPWATGIAPALTPLAAAGLTVVMLLAAAHHARHREWSGVVLTLVLAAVAMVIAIGRV